MKVYNLKIFETLKTLPRLAAQTSLGEPVWGLPNPPGGTP